MIIALICGYIAIGLSLAGFGLRDAARRGHRFESSESVLIVVMALIWPLVIVATCMNVMRGRNR